MTNLAVPEARVEPTVGDQGPVAQVTLWDVYRFAYSVALRCASWKHRTDILRLLLEPCNYWRNLEVPAVINHLHVSPGQRVLDIGSPKLASLFIWRQLKGEVYATDLFPYFFEEYSHYSARLRGPRVSTEYHIEQQDARQLRYPQGYFDRVYAISVLEHIEEYGDSKAMLEIARVLKPGGLCCLTVPFANRYRESTIDYEMYFKKPVDGKPVFYERHYDQESLQSRLVRPAGLSLAGLEFYGERVFPFEHYYSALPHPFRIALAPAGPFFSKLCLCRTDREGSPAPKMALVVLQKQ
jgi:ubiquinone/menaquinone biosynthesis C-methylase UbiE